MAARTRIQGFLFTDYQARMGEFYAGMAPLVAAGKVQSRDTVVDGLEKMPEAFLGLFEGANTGKMLVRV